MILRVYYYFCASSDCLWVSFCLVSWLCFPAFTADSDNQKNKANVEQIA